MMTNEQKADFDNWFASLNYGTIGSPMYAMAMLAVMWIIEHYGIATAAPMHPPKLNDNENANITMGLANLLYNRLEWYAETPQDFTLLAELAGAMRKYNKAEEPIA